MNKKTAMKCALAFFSCLLIVTCQLPLGVSYASNLSGVYQSSSMAMIDLYTQKEPYSGKGPNQTSDAFAPQEEVILYANVTYKGKPEQAKIVTFEVKFMGADPPLSLLTRTARTNGSGIATIKFRIPELCWEYGGPEALFGIWSVAAWVGVVEDIVKDTLTFKVGWIVEIVSIWTINENLQPQTRFAKGTCVGVAMVLRNIAMTPKKATLTLVVYDCENQPIADTMLEDVEIELGETSLHVVCKLQIPKWALLGYAVVYANAYTAPPQLGGVSYCPEVSAGFLITLCDMAVVGVTPSPTKVYAGELVNITVIVENEGRETETFNVTVYADKNVTVIGDEIIIGIQSVINLAPRNRKTLTFTWNTTSVTPGNYTISAHASVVPAEIDIADNTYIDGTVKIIKHPVAFFTYTPDRPTVGETVTFNATLSTPDGGTIISYVWDFGDGTPVVSETDPITTHVYTVAGTYNVTLTVIDDDGLNDTAKAQLTVHHLHDVAVIDVAPSLTEVYVGEAVTITVVAKNEGTATETFNIIVYYNGNIIGTKNVIGLAPGGSKTLTFSWDTSGVPVGEYVIKAVASMVPGETDIDDNTYIDGTVTVRPVRDVAVVGVTPSVTELNVGQVVNITVTVRNEGNVTENFDVTLYYDDTIIGTETVTGLEPGAEKTLIFSWDTSGVPVGEYVIKAVASMVPGETDIDDNVYVDGTVIVKSPPVYVFPRELALLGIIVAAVIVLTILAALLHRRRRRK